MSPLRPLVVVGAGGHGRELVDAAQAAISDGAPWELVGVVADGERHPERLAAHGVELLGGTALLEELDADFAIGIGSPAARHRLDTRFSVLGKKAATIVHPTATIATAVELGAGSYVAAGAVVGPNTRLGRHAHLDVQSSAAHDCDVSDYAIIGPGSHLAGWTVVGTEAELGIGVVTRPRVRIGEGAVVGAGAVVVSDVPSWTVSYGTPARVMRTIGPDDHCP